MQIRVKMTRSGGILTITIEEYLRGVVPAEVSASWPDAILHAQAIAARTYAIHKVQTRKKRPYDVDDTTAYQAYNPNKAHARTDAAIRATADLVLTYGGKVLDTCVYCASNGGEILSSKAAWGGHRAYLTARHDPYDASAGKRKSGHGVGMSQWGARQMALQGMDYDSILGFYYPGTFITRMTD